MKLFPEQEDAKQQALEYVANYQPGHKPFVLSGKAGTGKTMTTASIISQLVDNGNKVVVLAPTNRAAKIIRKTLQERTGIDDLSVKTIHKFMKKQVSSQVETLSAFIGEKAEHSDRHTPNIFDRETGETYKIVYEWKPQDNKRGFTGVEAEETFRLATNYFKRLKLDAETHSFIVCPKMEELKFIDTDYQELRDKYHGYTLIIDEFSMVPAEDQAAIYNIGLPTIYVGDDGQLPPVGEDAKQPRITDNVDVELQVVRRAADNTGITEMANIVRDKTGRLDGAYGDDDNCKVIRFTQKQQYLKKYGMSNAQAVLEEFVGNAVDNGYDLANTYFLVSRNKVVERLNNIVRGKLGFADCELPQTGERVISLKNNQKLGITKNEVFTVVDADKHPSKPVMNVLATDESGNPVILPMSFNDRKDSIQIAYCYAMTVHRSQGSGFDNVVWINDMGESELNNGPDYIRKMAYTAITRAKAKALVFNW